MVDSGAGKSAHTDLSAENTSVFPWSAVKKKGKRTGQTSSGYDQSVAPLQLFWRTNFDRLLFPERTLQRCESLSHVSNPSPSGGRKEEGLIDLAHGHTENSNDSVSGLSVSHFFLYYPFRSPVDSLIPWSGDFFPMATEPVSGQQSHGHGRRNGPDLPSILR